MSSCVGTFIPLAMKLLCGTLISKVTAALAPGPHLCLSVVVVVHHGERGHVVAGHGPERVVALSVETLLNTHTYMKYSLAQKEWTLALNE